MYQYVYSYTSVLYNTWVKVSDSLVIGAFGDNGDNAMAIHLRQWCNGDNGANSDDGWGVAYSSLY